MALFELTRAPVRGDAVLVARPPLPNGWPGSPLVTPTQDVVPEELSSVPVVVVAAATTCARRGRPRAGRRAGSAVLRRRSTARSPRTRRRCPRAARLLAWSEADGDFWTVRPRRRGRAGRRQPAAVGGASRGRTPRRPTTARPTWASAQPPRSRAPRLAHAARRVLPRARTPLPAAPRRARPALAAGSTRAGGARASPSTTGRRAAASSCRRRSSASSRPACSRRPPAGVPAWVDFRRPPAWLGGVLGALRHAPLGADPTPAPAPPERRARAPRSPRSCWGRPRDASA